MVKSANRARSVASERWKNRAWCTSPKGVVARRITPGPKSGLLPKQNSLQELIPKLISCKIRIFSRSRMGYLRLITLRPPKVETHRNSLLKFICNKI
ncbi:hypothetical protein CEXT_6071 [Caerostris extrusa]|uniref:Uncharacterized protein n=1 Tax=Caerostris extrusa TaxID=172846 RepID=A0AAV4VCY3_CAEEX|nr:hypothetical protein CEXT_6071 [Caerostris extrusa]